MMDCNLLDLQDGYTCELGLLMHALAPLGTQTAGSGAFFSSKCSKQEF